jgi:hypothetical protein
MPKNYEQIFATYVSTFLPGSEENHSNNLYAMCKKEKIVLWKFLVTLNVVFFTDDTKSSVFLCHIEYRDVHETFYQIFKKVLYLKH